MTILDFYFDYSSPFAYLGATQVQRIAQDSGAQLNWCPLLLGGLFRSIGTPMVPLFEMPASKQRYQRIDMERWAQHWGVPLSFPSRFPMNTVTALRMTLQLDNDARHRLALPLFNAYWVEDRDINDPEVLRQIADDAGFEGAALIAGAADPAIKQSLKDATHKAELAGVCGAPSFMVKDSADQDGMLFWGQDRVPLVEKALGGWRPACG